MFRRLELVHFKNFARAELSLGPLSLLVGTNASGKSNLREAFRFLHGISRGYLLAEILGEKWIEGGVLQWRGIRGGTREVAYRGQSGFALTAEFVVGGDLYRYIIKVEMGSGQEPLRVYREALYNTRKAPAHLGPPWRMVFDSHSKQTPPKQKDLRHLSVRLPRGGDHRKLGQVVDCISMQPALSQLLREDVTLRSVRQHIRQALQALGSMRFLDLAPDAMRMPSLPGQTILGDRGENLSSVLQAICESPERKHALLEWLRELTPLDVRDLVFESDPAGRILVSLVEEDGHRTSAYSASDGTLRFLAMIAALLGPETARFYFFEELDNGIHPTRLHLLLQLIEQRVMTGETQLVATTHSPQLLTFLSDRAREHASLVYRLPGAPDARIRRILDIPEAARVIAEQDLARLHASGWLEDAVAFTEEDEGESAPVHPPDGGAGL